MYARYEAGYVPDFSFSAVQAGAA